MKKINFSRIIWVACTFLILLIILYLVIIYKVHYQHLVKNKIYFYECEDTLCVSEVKDNDKLMYSYYDCGYEECPIYTKNINDDYVILKKQNKLILYNYRKGITISQDYDNYQFINSDYIIVTKNNFQGVININNQITIPIIYTKIGYKQDEYLLGYNTNSIIVQKEEQYGIISYKNGDIIEEIKYKEEELEQLLNLLIEESNTNE